MHNFRKLLWSGWGGGLEAVGGGGEDDFIEGGGFLYMFFFSYLKRGRGSY